MLDLADDVIEECVSVCGPFRRSRRCNIMS